jgi:TolB-like protein
MVVFPGTHRIDRMQTQPIRRFWIIVSTGLFLSGFAPRVQADPIKSVAKQLAKGLTDNQDHQIAVIPFAYPDGGLSSGSSVVSERLITCLAARPHMRIVERSQLPQVLEELRVETSGLTSVSGAQKLGKMLSVDEIVTGTLIDEGSGRTEVHARLIQVESGLVLAAASTVIPRTWADQPVKPVRIAETPNGDADRWIKQPVVPSRSLEMVEQVYQSSTDPKVRAGALYSMGIILEREGRTREAADMYRRLISEYPEDARLTTDALGRLWARRP